MPTILSQSERKTSLVDRERLVLCAKRSTSCWCQSILRRFWNILSLEWGLLFEAVLVRLNHELNFPFQGLLRSIPYEALNWRAVTEEDHRWGSHDAKLGGELIVVLV